MTGYTDLLLSNIRFNLGDIVVREVEDDDRPRFSEIARKVALKATKALQQANISRRVLARHGLVHLDSQAEITDDRLFCPYARLQYPFDESAAGFCRTAAEDRVSEPRCTLRFSIVSDGTVIGGGAFTIQPFTCFENEFIGDMGMFIDPAYQNRKISNRVVHALYYFLFNVIVPIQLSRGSSGIHETRLLLTSHPLNETGLKTAKLMNFRKYRTAYIEEYKQPRVYHTCSLYDAMKWYYIQRNCIYLLGYRDRAFIVDTIAAGTERGGPGQSAAGA